MMQPPHCIMPNQQAQPGRLDVFEDGVKFHGCQEYTLGRHTLQLSEADVLTTAKKGAVESFFVGHNFRGRSFLDLEANSGFFAFWAVQLGASQVTALDIDSVYISIMRDAANSIGLQHLRVCDANVINWEEPADIVLASSTMHSIYCYLASLGSLEQVVEKLARLTQYALLIEWAEPNDPDLLLCQHLKGNEDAFNQLYYQHELESVLSSYFKEFKVLAKISETRTFLVAFKNRQTIIDLSCPLPALLDDKQIISSKMLYSLDGIDYWSRIYDAGPDLLIKQTSGGLAIREKKFLDELSGPYFPRVVSSKVEAEYSLYYMEKIHGELLSQIDPSSFDEDSFYKLVNDCLEIIDQLQSQGITHRNIFADNIILRNGKPVLIDFGWSDKAGNTCIVPLSLPRAPDGQPCDIYSLAETLSEIAAGRYPELDKFFSLMMDSDPSLRITDAKTLLFLFDRLQTGVQQGKQSHAYKVVDNILDNLNMRASHNAFLERKLAETWTHSNGLVAVVNDLETRNLNQQAELHQLRSNFQQLQTTSQQLHSEVQRLSKILQEISQSKAWKIGSLLQRIHAKLRHLRLL